MTALARRPASPYARRLARERGLALASITGSGPNGRIVAADIQRAASLPTPGPLPYPAAAATASASAFTTSISIRKLNALLTEFGAAQLPLTLDVMLLRAAGSALAAVPAANRIVGTKTNDEDTKVVVSWEIGGGVARRPIVLSEPQNGLVSALGARLAAGLEDAPNADSGSPALSIRRIAQAGIRPTAMPLLPGYAMRLVVLASDAADAVDCLLCFDAQLVGEDDAAAFLARFRDDLETPVRLLA